LKHNRKVQKIGSILFNFESQIKFSYPKNIQISLKSLVKFEI